MPQFTRGLALALLAITMDALAAARPWQPPYPAENLLPNSSFEATSDAREIYPIIGEYRHTGAGEWAIDDTQHWHGKQCLRMAGTTPFFWQVLNWDCKANAFSVYLKGSKPGIEVELGFELLSFIDDGAVHVEGRQRKTVKLTPQWQRYEVASTIERKRETYVRLHMFRAWVRPLSADKLWVDAAQVEKGRTQATEYKPARGYNEISAFFRKAMSNPIVTDGADEPSWEGKRSRTGRVMLTVRETSGAARDGGPVSGGVPFPPGELFDETAARLYDAAGSEVPCQTRALARRHIDGSIRSLLVHFQASVPALAAARYELRYGQAGPPLARPLAVDNGEAIVIDTGAIRATVRKGAFRWFDALQAGARRITPGPQQAGCYAQPIDGALYGSEWGKPAEVRIESNGPLHAVIYARGSHSAAQGGGTFLDYEARIHAFAGKAYFRLEATFENREPAMNTPVRSISVRLPIAEQDEGAACRFHIERGPDVVAQLSRAHPASVTQLHQYYGLGGYEVAVSRGGHTDRVENARASGRVAAGDAVVDVAGFWRRNPKAIEVAREHVAVFHWPHRFVKFADLPFGMANTMRIVYAPFGAAAKGERLLLQPDPEWVAKTGVFGHWLTNEQAAKHCPRFNGRVNTYFAALAHDREILDLTGTFDYGDFGQPGCWMNNETCAGQHLWMQYLRTGDPALFRRAEAMSLHTREVDVCHIGPGSRLMHHPSGGFHTTQSWHIGHYWITGLIYHYLLTGDARTFHVVRDLGANPLIKYRNARYTGRERTRMLFHLAELYDLTHLKCFRHAFETHYNYGKPTLTYDYSGGSGLLALKRWYDTTGERKYLDRFVKDADNVVKVRSTEPFRDVGSGRGWHIFSAMAEAARVTGDRRFIDAFHERMVWYLVSVHGFDHSAVRGFEFLEAARRLGIAEHESMPEHLVGIDIFTGLSAKFALRVRDDRDEPFILRVYRTRNFRASQRKSAEDAIAYRVARPDGSVLAEGKLDGPTYLTRRIDVPADGQRGDYAVQIDCISGGQGAFSCSHPKVFLDGRGAFAFRRIRSGAGLAQFVAQAPRHAGQVRLRLTWRDMPGQATGAWMQDAAGRVVARARWAVPMGATWDDEGREMGHADRLDLPVPAAYRGKPLALTITSAKWLRWQLEGLDDPWLRPK